jgi:hypothetical protein
MKSTIVTDVTACSLIYVHRCFRETYCLHLQVQREAKQATSKNKREKSKASSTFCLILDGKLTRLYGVTPQNSVRFILIVCLQNFQFGGNLV